MKPETRVKVRYVPADPQVARLEQQFGSPSYLVLCMGGGMGGLFTLIGLFIIGHNVRSIYAVRQLDTQGQIGPGSLVDRWTETNSDGDKVYVVAYQFSAPACSPITVAEFNRPAYDKFQPGDPVRVRYLPHKPKICRLEIERELL